MAKRIASSKSPSVNSDNTYVASFSSYLSTTKKEGLYLGKKTRNLDGEIGVFSAEKYFSEGMEAANTRALKGAATKLLHKNHENQGTRQEPGRKQFQRGTPSNRSESSWNSQSTLLHAARPRNLPRSKSSGANVMGFLANFGCNCCRSSDKSSVGTIDGFMDNNFQRKMVPREPFKTSLDLVDLSQRTDEKVMSFGRRLSMLNQATVETEIPRVSSGINDNESDASSDLFEIESFSSKLNQFLAQQAFDGTPGCVTPSTCYAPSEASISWSVVTASAADFSTVSGSPKLAVAATSTPRSTSREIQRRRPGILLGCRSEKAVSVAGNATRACDQRPNPDPRSCPRSEMSTKMAAGSEFRQGQHESTPHSNHLCVHH